MRRQSKYIAYIFLGFFLFTFGFQNAAALTRNFQIDLVTIFNGKYLKTIDTPADDTTTEENPFENETEDESETEVNPGEMIVSFTQEFFFHSGDGSRPVFSDHVSPPSGDQPLYLVIRTFRI